MSTRRDFLPAVQAHVARLSVGASTLRGQGAPGAVAASRRFLVTLPLQQFAVSRAETFYPRLDAATAELRDALPDRARSWGAARKVVNIFLRNALYNGYLRDRYRLDVAEPVYEVPLDGIVAARLLVADTRKELPRWPGVRHLTQEASASYQHVARRAARRARMAPVPRHVLVRWRSRPRPGDWSTARGPGMTVVAAYAGIDVAFAKKKRLPISVCTRGHAALVPLPLRAAGDLLPPRGSGNWATLDEACVDRFADDAASYLHGVERRFGVQIERVAIDAPRAYAPDGSRRAAEQAMDRLRISCFSTPDRTQFARIRAAVVAHITSGGSQPRTPFANQLWILVGFALFERLEREFACIEVFPNAIIQAIEPGVAHKSTAVGLHRQTELVAAATGYAGAGAREVAHGPAHDRLDALMAAWVASLPTDQLDAHGDGGHDTIWAPRRRVTRPS